MALSKDQKALLTAIRKLDHAKIMELLFDKEVDLHYPDFSPSTPLHEAVKKNNLVLTRMLIDEGADVHCLNKDARTPAALARELQADWELIDLLDTRGMFWGNSGPRAAVKRPAVKKPKPAAPRSRKKTPAAKPKTPVAPAFEGKTLTDTFNPQKWIGNTDKMQELWNKVPKRLQKDFNFEAAKADAQQQTAKQKIAAPKIILKKAA